MISYSQTSFIKQLIDKAITSYDKSRGLHIPVEITTINPDNTVNVTSLINPDIKYINMQCLLLPGIQYNLNNLKYGILIPIDYSYLSLLTKGVIEVPYKANMNNFGYVLPVLHKDDLENFNKHKDKDLVLHNKDYKNTLTLDTNITIDIEEKNNITLDNSSINMNVNNKSNLNLTEQGISINGTTNPLEIKNDTTTLKQLLTDILDVMNDLATQTQSPQGPCSNPTAVGKLPALQTKLNQLLK